MKIKPRTFQEILEGLHDLCQRFARSRSGVHGLDAVVVGLGQKSVGRVHQKTLALAFAAAMAVSPKVLRVFKFTSPPARAGRQRGRRTPPILRSAKHDLRWAFQGQVPTHPFWDCRWR